MVSFVINHGQHDLYVDVFGLNLWVGVTEARCADS